jgi:hypothetical protein
MTNAKFKKEKAKTYCHATHLVQQAHAMQPQREIASGGNKLDNADYHLHHEAQQTGVPIKKKSDCTHLH